MSQIKVVVTDQVFPDVEVERKVLADAGAELVVADGRETAHWNSRWTPTRS